MGFLDLFQTQPILKKHQSNTREATIPEKKEGQEETYTMYGNLIKIKVTKELYSLEEPEQNEKQKETIEKIKEALIEILNKSIEDHPQETLEKYIRLIIAELELTVSEQFLNKTLYFCYKDILGLGKIEAILKDPMVTQISYNAEKKLLEVMHKKYGTIKTNISFEKEETKRILQKLAQKGNKELQEQKIKYKTENQTIEIDYNAKNPEESSYSIKKEVKKYLSPTELIKEKRIQPIQLAFLWMCIHDKKDIFFKEDITMLHALSFFLPMHTKIRTSLIDYTPNPFTTTIFGKNAGDEDFVIGEKENKANAILISSQTEKEEQGNIICYVENSVLTKMKDNGVNIVSYENKTFRESLSESAYLNAKEDTKAGIEELKTRAKLLTVLASINMKDEEYQKIIAAYQENPQAVLRKAKIL